MDCEARFRRWNYGSCVNPTCPPRSDNRIFRLSTAKSGNFNATPYRIIDLPTSWVTARTGDGAVASYIDQRAICDRLVPVVEVAKRNQNR